MSEFRIQRLCIVGVGLIGGSLARALRKAGVVDSIVGCGRNQALLRQAIQLEVIDEMTSDLRDAVSQADVVVIAVPVGQMSGIFDGIKHALKPGAIVTDVGSTKGSVTDALRQVYGEEPEWFVPGHPIAGTEKSGVTASFAELYQQRRVILTPTRHTSSKALGVVRKMWEAVGANVVEISVEHHDAVLAATSHLPHMLAYALVDTLARMDDSREIFEFAAGGFRDFTRIASSNPDMWHDICFANRAELVRVMERFIKDLTDLADAIRKGDSDYLRQTFERAKKERDALCRDQEQAARGEE